MPPIEDNGYPPPPLSGTLSAGWQHAIWQPHRRPGVRCWQDFKLPLSLAHRKVGAGAAGVRTHQLSGRLTGALGELARAQHTTVNTVLQGAWALLLTSLTGQQDVVFGSVVSGRPADVPGAESMVGLLINTVPVRANISAATTTADLLDQLTRSTLKRWSISMFR